MKKTLLKNENNCNIINASDNYKVMSLLKIMLFTLNQFPLCYFIQWINRYSYLFNCKSKQSIGYIKFRHSRWRYPYQKESLIMLSGILVVALALTLFLFMIPTVLNDISFTMTIGTPGTVASNGYVLFSTYHTGQSILTPYSTYDGADIIPNIPI